MLLSLDVPALDLLAQILENNSTHAVLYYIATLEKVDNPEEFANAADKLLTKPPELFERFE